MKPQPSIAIVVTTFRRSELLAPLLTEIRAQMNQLKDATARLIIVDNDPDESARDVAAEFDAEYAPEHMPGIASARQRALTESVNDDALIMLDDDVTPEPNWLVELIGTWRQHQATVIMAYVRWIWPPIDDPLLRKIQLGGFMRRAEVPTGTPQDWLATGNILIDMKEAHRLNLSFDVTLGLSGGEDTLFGRQVLARGGTIIACRESSATSELPADRATVDFVWRRAIGQGTTMSYLSLRDHRGLAVAVHRARLLVTGAARWGVFSVGRLAKRISGDAAAEGRYLRRSWTAQGRIRGAVGRISDEYARPGDAAQEA